MAGVVGRDSLLARTPQGAYQEPGRGVQAKPLRGRYASPDTAPGTLMRRSCPTEEGTPPRPVVAEPGHAGATRRQAGTVRGLTLTMKHGLIRYIGGGG